MLICEIVRQTGVSRDTIRYYERLGLLQAEGRPSPFNTYEAYPAATVTRLGLIQ
jgi:DNA-binding transcriptional MerR regulator